MTRKEHNNSAMTCAVKNHTHIKPTHDNKTFTPLCSGIIFKL